MRNQWLLFCMCLLGSFIFSASACKKQNAQNPSTNNPEMTDQREMPKTLPAPSPEEIQQKEMTANVMQELAAFLNKQQDLSIFGSLVDRLVDKNILTNVQRQRYRLLAPTNSAMKSLPEREYAMLTDDSGTHLGYQMKFFIYHICPQPNNPHQGFAYRVLAGQDVRFQSDSVEMPGLKRKVAFKTTESQLSKVDVIKISGPLFY